MTLRQLREDRGLTQQETAVLSGLDQTHISVLELGQSANPTLATLDALAAAYQTSRDAIVLALKKSVADARARQLAGSKLA